MNIESEVKEGLTYFELANSLGGKLHLCNYGARLIGFDIPVKNEVRNVVVSGKTKEDFEDPSKYFGATIGRVAGRIDRGEIRINGINYPLPTNEKKITLHGGKNSFESKLFEFEVNESKGQVTFSYHSPHLENGFPGNLDVKVVYTLLENENTYTIEYFAKSDEDTVFNPTNHGYYNLTGDSEETIDNHLLEVFSDEFLELRDDSIPTGRKLPVSHTGMDFSKGAFINQAFVSKDPQNVLVNGLDHPFIFKDGNHQLILTSPKEDVALTVTTDRDAVVLFTSNFKENVVFSNEVVVPHGALAIETQNLPDAMHHEDFGNVYLKAGEDFYSKTSYQFATK